MPVHGRSTVFRQQPARIRAVSTTQTVSVSDTFTPSEAFLKRVDKLLADAVSLVEARLLTVGKRVADSVSLTEGFSALRVVVKPVADAVALTEARLVSIGKVLAEAVGLSESLGIQTTGAVVGWDAYLFWRRRTQMRRAYILRYRTRCGLRV